MLFYAFDTCNNKDCVKNGLFVTNRRTFLQKKALKYSRGRNFEPIVTKFGTH